MLRLSQVARLSARIRPTPLYSPSFQAPTSTFQVSTPFHASRIQRRGFFTQKIIQVVASSATKVIARGGTVVIATGAGGYALLTSFKDYLDSWKIPKIQMPEWDYETLSQKIKDLRQKLELKRKERTVNEVNEVNEVKEASTFARIAQIALYKPLLNQPLDRRATEIGDGEFMYIIKRLVELRNTLSSIPDLKLQLPTIVVIGAQSSGKSSVLESIVGHEFLPKGNNMVTRRPLELTLVYTPNSTEEYGEFPDIKMTYKDFNEIQKVLKQMNESVPEKDHVSDEPIRLTIYSPKVPDLSLVDLPGYIRVTSNKQPTELKNRIIDLCRKYLREPNIILAVSASDVDLANSDALKESRKVDPLGLRTLGVLTKMDLIKPSDGIQMLLHNEYNLDLGYVGIVSQSSQSSKSSQKSNVNVDEMDNYFRNHSDYNDPNVEVGISRLREKLQKILLSHMLESLQQIVEQVKSELDETRYQLKVEYNDMKISEDSYLSNIVSNIKQKFTSLSSKFKLKEIREIVQTKLEAKIFQICEDVYWNVPSSNSPLDPKYCPVANPTASGEYQNPNVFSPNGQVMTEEQKKDYLKHSLHRSTSLLTKSGIGQMATKTVVEHLKEMIEKIINEPPFDSQTDIKEKILQIEAEYIRSRLTATIQQVEIGIKPYKYEIEVTDYDWMAAYNRTLLIMEKEIKQSQQQHTELLSKLGKSEYQTIKQRLEMIHAKEREKKKALSEGKLSPEPNGDGAPSPSLDDFSPQNVLMAKEIRALESRVTILKMRQNYIKKNGKDMQKSSLTCPEVYLEVVTTKISEICALFINSELLADFYFYFPEQVDQRLYYKLSQKEKLDILRKDKRALHQLELQRKRENLETANDQLSELLRHSKRSQTQKKKDFY